MLIEVARDRIRTLRAIGAPRDPLAFRLDLERMLGTVSLRATGVPPSAIVCVRRLRVARPAARAAEWATELDSQMQRLLARSVRPFHEAVPATAEAVVFFDEAELLACLARDYKRGDGDAWWWRSLFGAAASETLVRQTFAAHTSVVPAAIDRLAERSIAADVVRSLPSSYCEQLGAAVATTFGVQGWTETPQARSDEMDRDDPRAGDSRARSSVLERLSEILDTQRADDSVTLSPPQRALLGLSLMLCRAPALARAPGLVITLRAGAWLRLSSGGVAASVDAFARARSADPQIRDSSLRKPATPDEAAAPSPDLSSDLFGAHDDARHEPTPWQECTTDADVADRAPEVVDLARGTDPANEPPTAVTAPPPPYMDRPAIRVHAVDSEFAGALYLINIALHLELYGDFAQPGRPGIELPLGDFLALAGDRTCGERFRNDAIWDLLAELSAREPTEPPGLDFTPPDAIDLESWLKQLTATLASCAGHALDVDQETALPFLCARPGRVALSPTRLDATFPLAAHPLAIRVAGLDRDPGWVPAAGRVVAFHYE